MNNEQEGFLFYVAGIVSLWIFLVGLWIGVSYFEMKTFNKFSEKKAVITDAMFAELRIFAQ